MFGRGRPDELYERDEARNNERVARLEDALKEGATLLVDAAEVAVRLEKALTEARGLLDVERLKVANLEAAAGHALHEVRNALVPAVMGSEGASAEAVLRAVRGVEPLQRAIFGGTSALDAYVEALVAAERARIRAALRSAWAVVIDVGASKGGVYINGAHAIYEPMFAAISGAP